MRKTRLKNNFNKIPTSENWAANMTQRNLSFKIFRRNKKFYHAQPDPKVVNDNKRF